MENQNQAPLSVTPTPATPPSPVQPISGSPIQTISSPPKQNFLKLVIFILLVLLLASGSLAYYFWYQAKTTQPVVSNTAPEVITSPTASPLIDETINWETYTNSIVGYTIKHPSDWLPSLKSPSAAQQKQGFDTYTLSMSKDDYKLQITTSSAGGGGIICIFNDSTKDEINGPAWDQLGTPYEIGTFLNQKARRNLNPITSVSQYGSLHQTLDYTYEACVPVESDYEHTDGKKAYTSTINVNNIIVYNAYYTPRENINADYLKTMDKMLSTLEFTDQDQANNISTWKTYTNASHGYSLSYPSDWSAVTLDADTGGGTARSDSNMVDIQSKDLLLGNATISVLQLMPSKTATQTESTEKIGNYTFTIWVTKVDNMLSKTYYLKLKNGSYLEILVRPISNDNQAIFENMIKSIRVI